MAKYRGFSLETIWIGLQESLILIFQKNNLKIAHPRMLMSLFHERTKQNYINFLGIRHIGPATGCGDMRLSQQTYLSPLILKLMKIQYMSPYWRLKKKIKESPEFDPSTPVNSEYEKILYDYYGRPVDGQINKELQQKIGKIRL